MHKLDLKDKKILYQLDIDSRQSYNELARKVGLSKDSVINRINNLIKQKAIKKFYTLIDIGKLNLIDFRLYLKLKDSDPAKQEEIIKFLKKQKQVMWIVSIDGKYDIGISIVAKSIKEMNLIWKKILKKYLNFISKRNLTIFTKVTYFSREYLLEKEVKTKEYTFITEPENIKLDKKELEILKLLSDNARIPLIDLAEKTFLTTKTISSKIKKLEKDKIIVGYRTMFDLEKLGYQYFKLHINLKNINSENEKKFRNFVKEHPNIVYDNEVLGGDDFEIEIQIPTIQEFRALIDLIKKKFPKMIKDYEYMIYYKEHEFKFFPK